MKTETINIYKFSELSDSAKEKAYDYIRTNWHYLGENVLYESIDSLKKFSEFYGLDLDYSISIFPDRGENITAKISNDDIYKLRGVRLFKYLTNNFEKILPAYSKDKKLKNMLAESCPFTGMMYDETLLDKMREFMKKPSDIDFQDLIDDCTSDLLKAIHSEGDYIYSYEGLKEMILDNDEVYDFLEDGTFH